MGKIAKNATQGSALLTVIGLGLACNDIASTDDTQKKNEILVESVGGVFGGPATGVVILLIFTPVGWVGAVGGFGAGKVSGYVYNTYGQQVDIASATGVSKFCK